MAWRPRALLHVFYGVVCLSFSFRVALRLGGLFPCHSHTPCLSHGFLVLCVRGIVAGVLFCWWSRGGCALSLVRGPRLPFVVWLRGVSCNILGSAAGVFSWRLPYVVLLFCFVCWCWGAHKSPTPIACTLLSDLGHATFCNVPLSRLGGSFVLQKGRLVCNSGSHSCPASHRRTGPLAPHDNHSLAEGHRFCPNLASNHLLCYWSAHKSLAPRTRTLLGAFGQATLNFVAVATLLFFSFCECPKFCDLAKQARKIFLGVSEVGKIDFALYFFWLCVFFLVFYFLLLQSRDGPKK